MTYFWCEKHKQAHAKGDDGRECLLVGPFPSKEEAEAWPPSASVPQIPDDVLLAIISDITVPPSGLVIGTGAYENWALVTIRRWLARHASAPSHEGTNIVQVLPLAPQPDTITTSTVKGNPFPGTVVTKDLMQHSAPSSTVPNFIDARMEWIDEAVMRGLPSPSRDELAAFHDGFKAALSATGTLREAAWAVHRSAHHHTRPNNHYRVSMASMDALDKALTEDANDKK